mmetsp:Transcript_7362/g.10202  ORF Transcript_7362/g.10202 Transcript_7362/m.10202 type:complete len:258 (+) Transcript_7362:525-1298(+)|eukprot:CAMPEP_0168548660 /NCGR_PEP_ID=MMETSP0413-20121227/4685_1 /TAXON_ID=136452 /ORGANISM="Filamoeba nolandi, Strain NC-AS-23-1" /LENGTH=257 /DNA_ID=CAMNT_0008578989 /DNA_START=501 /DNA_END=1274 /DNA_ORIENTATION=+
MSLFDELKNMQKKPFLDVKSKFELHDLEELVKESNLFALILTAGIFESDWCHREFEAAVDNNKDIVIIKDFHFKMPPASEAPAQWRRYVSQMLNKKHKFIEYDAVYASRCAHLIFEKDSLMKIARDIKYEGPKTISTSSIRGPYPDEMEKRIFSFHTNCDSNAWWKMTLPQILGITKIVLVNSKDCSERINPSTIKIFNEKNEVTATFSIRDVRSVYEWEILDEKEGKYIEVRLDHTNYLHFWSLDVYYNPIFQPNV